jgi:NADH dehydrogenase (ubiquinone) Fe-S protein 1
MFNIRINQNTCIVTNSELTVLQQCELNSIYIPRFCYHDRLSIAGNCRMCLIELENAVKPVIACSTSLMPNMSIFTNSKTVKKIRENILEFLLINHPLDCPICDQGGECDLQDQAMVFGSDRGRFIEIKRSVEDKNFGPFIKTIMTRCIHCTRCIRFFDEIAGLSILGMMGRGKDAEISTYANLGFESELSGNVIDLCPVGALTSKPYAFTSRPWELTSFESIDIFDSLGSNLRIDIKGNIIMRILPKLNDEINEEWITDQIRFSYDGLRRERLTFPLIRLNIGVDTLFAYSSWNTVIARIRFIFENTSNQSYHVYSGNLIDLFSLFLFRYWLDQCESYINFYCDAFLQSNICSSFLFTSDLTKLNEFNSILFYNLNLKQNISVLNIRIRKLKWKLKDNFQIFYVGMNTSFNYKYKHLGLSINTMLQIIRGKHFICSTYVTSSMCCMTKPSDKNVLNVLTKYIQNSALNTISTDVSDIHYNLLGFSHRNKYILNNVSNNALISIYYLLNYNKNIPILTSQINNVLSYVIYHGSYGNHNAMNSDLVMPMLNYTETRGLYMNLEGCIQVSEQITYGPGTSKSSSDIFLLLTNAYIGSSKLHRNYLTNLFNIFLPTKQYKHKLNIFSKLITFSNTYLINSTNIYKERNNEIINNSFIYNKRLRTKVLY